MDIRNARLGENFWCHAKLPHWGNSGEIARAAVLDLNLTENVDFQNETIWKFKKWRNYKSSYSHDVGHIFAAIIALYEPKLHHLLPYYYNGCSQGEATAMAVVSHMTKYFVTSLKEYKVPTKESCDAYASEYFTDEAKVSFKPYADSYIELEKALWFIQGENEVFQEFIEIRSAYGFVDPNIMRHASYFKFFNPDNIEEGATNKHGVVFTPPPTITEEELNAVSQRLNFLFDDNILDDFIEKRREIGNCASSFEFVKKMTGDIAVRDLHLLIGGEEKALEFFKSCQISDKEIAQTLSPSVDFKP